LRKINKKLRKINKNLLKTTSSLRRGQCKESLVNFSSADFCTSQHFS
jgi:hypothetical protein